MIATSGSTMKMLQFLTYLLFCSLLLVDNYVACDTVKVNDKYDNFELKRIKKCNGLVKRVDPHTLVLKLTNGKKAEIKDNTDENDEGGRLKHTFYEFDRHIFCYLIHRELWEDGDVLAVNINNGKKYMLPALPRHNKKSKNRFACYTESTILHSAILHLYRFDSNGLNQEYEYVTDEWDFENLEWISDFQLNMDFVTYKDLGYTFEIDKSKKMVLIYYNDKWHLEFRHGKSFPLH